jgi:NAD(P)-dependent dehydrogenase (short-subunit alcohol dehydrogenase family)
MMNDNFINLKNKFCFVTGSNGYIGKTICQKLIKQGAIVIHTDIKKNKIKSKNSFFFKADLKSKKEINILVKKIKKKFKKIDVLVNNAGYVATSDLGKQDSMLIYNEEYIKLNLNNTIYLTDLIIPSLKKSKQGSIINICSIYSFLTFDYNLYKGTAMKAPLAYGVSKAGLMHYTKMLSTSLAPKIKVNSISPGGIFRNQPSKFIKKYLLKTPLNRMCNENDVANAVIFFSSELSSYITGHNLVVDGGYSLS